VIRGYVVFCPALSGLVLTFGITVTYSGQAAGASCLAAIFARRVKIAAGEGPLERGRRPLIVALEGKKPLFEVGQRGEVVGREDLSLDDRKVDFDLVEPTGVDRSVDEDRVGPFGVEAVDRFLATMSGAVVHDPEDAASGLVGLLAHDFTDETLYRSHPILDLAVAEELGAMNVPSGQIGPGTSAKVFMLDSGGAVRSGGQRRLFSASSLNTGLLVRRDHEVIGAQWSALPNALVKVQDGTGVGRKVGITREDPASMSPRAESVGAQPTPQGGAADFRETLRNHVLPDLLEGEGVTKEVRGGGEFAGAPITGRGPALRARALWSFPDRPGRNSSPQSGQALRA
jgi:hypothetical protein